MVVVMAKIIRSKSIIYSLAFFLIGLVTWYYVTINIEDSDKYHLLILLPILLPMIGLISGTVGIFKAPSYIKLLALSLVLINIGLIVTIFVDYAFSYWEF